MIKSMRGWMYGGNLTIFVFLCIQSDSVLAYNPKDNNKIKKQKHLIIYNVYLIFNLKWWSGIRERRNTEMTIEILACSLSYILCSRPKTRLILSNPICVLCEKKILIKIYYHWPSLVMMNCNLLCFKRKCCSISPHAQCFLDGL